LVQVTVVAPGKQEKYQQRSYHKATECWRFWSLGLNPL